MSRARPEGVKGDDVEDKVEVECGVDSLVILIAVPPLTSHKLEKG